MAACCSSIGSATTLVAKIVGSSAMTDTASSSRSISSTTSSEAAAPASTATCISRGSKPGSVNRTTYSAAGSMSKTKRPSSPVTCSRAAGSGPPVTATLTPGRAPPPTSVTDPSIAPVVCARVRGAGSSVDAARRPAARAVGSGERGDDVIGTSSGTRGMVPNAFMAPWPGALEGSETRTGERPHASPCPLHRSGSSCRLSGCRQGDHVRALFCDIFVARSLVEGSGRGVARRGLPAGTCRRSPAGESTVPKRSSAASNRGAQYRNRYDSFVKNARLVCRRAVVGKRTASNRSPC